MVGPPGPPGKPKVLEGISGVEGPKVRNVDMKLYCIKIFTFLRRQTLDRCPKYIFFFFGRKYPHVSTKQNDMHLLVALQEQDKNTIHSHSCRYNLL